jgi:O-antigen/teichoic acid export membrane protein
MSSIRHSTPAARPVLRPSRTTEPSRPVAELDATARGSLANLTGLAVSGLFQLILVVVIAHALGARGTGIFFSAIALFTIASNVGELGADTGLVRFVSRFRSIGREADLHRLTVIAVAPVAILGIGLGLSLYVFAPQLAEVFSRGRATTEMITAVRVLAPFVPIASLGTVILSATRGWGRMGPYVAIQNIALPIVRPGAIVALVAAGFGGIAVVGAWALPLLGALVAGTLALKMLLDRNALSVGPTTPARSIAADFWRFTAPRALAAVFGITITWLDILLVSGLRTAREAGIYASVSRLSIVGAFALNAVGMAIAPQLSSLLARHRHRDAQAVTRIATAWLIALTWPLYITAAVFGDVILQVLGREMSAGYAALAILALAQLVNVGTGNVVILLLMGGRSSLALINSAVALALNVGLNLVLIPTMGIRGAAIAWTVSILFNNVAALVEVRIVLGISPLGERHALIAGLSALCFGVLGLVFRWLLGATPAALLAFTGAAGCLYVIVLWNLRDRLEIPTLLRSIRRPRREPDPVGAET